MMGKMGLFSVLTFFGILLLTFNLFTYSGHSAEYEVGTTTMNVTIRGYVSISISDCLTAGITFATQDPNTNDNNATCNNASANGGTDYNLTIGTESTVNVNFTHASNRSNLTTGTYIIDIGNVTSNSNSTANNGSNLLNATESISLNNSWGVMENCTSLVDGENCWVTYFLDVPINQPPGTYITGYCWCGRETNKAETLCGTCT